MDTNGVVGLAVVCALAAGAFFLVERRDRALKKQQVEWDEARSIEVVAARIEEQVHTTQGAQVCGVLLTITGMITGAIFLLAGTAFGQIEAALVFIAAALLFGLGIALGRRRVYVVYQTDPTRVVARPAVAEVPLTKWTK